MLLHDFDDAVGSRVDQNRAVVHHRVAIIAHAIFRRHVVIADAGLRQDRADPDVLAISIGGTVLFDDIAVKARTLIDAQNAVNSSDHAADDTADDGADGTGRSFALSRALINPAGDPLGLRRNGKRHCGYKGSNTNKTPDHDIS
jgi:hypothetical protein